MAEGNSSGGKSKSRLALSDLTNRIGKRRISGREKDKVKCFDFGDNDKVKRICVSPRPCPEINSLKGNVVSGLSKVSNENRDPNVSGFESSHGVSNDDCDGGHCVKGNKRFLGGNEDIEKFDLKGGDDVLQDVNDLPSVVGDSCNQIDPNPADKEGGKVLSSISNENKCPNQSIDTEVRDELGDSYSTDTSKTTSETGNGDGKNCDNGEVNMNSEGIDNDANSHHNGLDDHNADNFVLSQSGSVDCMILPQSQESRVFGILPQSQESRVFGIDGSTKQKEDEFTNMTEGTNSIGACSCSFCTKAAYIWLELHHKDIKARLSALKKGQKDASILGERSCRVKADEKHGSQSVPRVSELESNLMHQWRSLFKFMSNTWEDEGNQLEANLLQLNNLREKCKADLERINAEQSEKH